MAITPFVCLAIYLVVVYYKTSNRKLRDVDPSSIKEDVCRYTSVNVGWTPERPLLLSVLACCLDRSLKVMAIYHHRQTLDTGLQSFGRAATELPWDDMGQQQCCTAGVSWLAVAPHAMIPTRPANNPCRAALYNQSDNPGPRTADGRTAASSLVHLDVWHKRTRKMHW